MFDIAWSEMVLIGAVALVVIGPKDLPKALRTVGQTVSRIRRMAAEFQGQFNEAMREAELADLKKQVEDVGGSVSSALNNDYKPIEEPKDFSAASVGEAAKPEDAALKEAEAKLAALPTPELPPVDIAAETPTPAEEPVPAAKPKRTRKAKTQEEPVAESAPAAETAPSAEASEAAEKAKPARERKVKAVADAPEEPDTPFPEAGSAEAPQEAPKPARKRKPKAATAKGEETSA
ncbi:twin-arginine translocase subunit TatB [Bosea sp. F3-2]|uniref:Sec-independent protein translocase protein TatB n=1 Tax=Bosea sp. F3-2 TaxID=2599640 RepID=UPI0011EF9AAC|nr:Sec-independent protein translocase protein TatB [Bosea sp. F3-2]QEL21429.1 twin-arginine translocase subunit TatB [Bosea sp. F3-2]